MDDQEDEELKRAIALSLEEAAKPPPRRQETPGREGDDEEAQFQRDLELAIAASQSASTQAQSSRQNDASNASKRTEAQTEASNGQSSMRPPLISERAKMEKERLERLKRQHGEEPNGGVASTCTSGPSAKKQCTSRPVSSQAAGTSGTSTNGSRLNALFWDGELRQTANRAVDRDNDYCPTFRLSEILGPKSEITLAILSSYSTNADWLYSFFEETTPIILVNQPAEDGNARTKALAPNMIMTSPFLRNGRGCMHIKIMLIFYRDERLRVIVPTANFVDYDWRDIENSVWVQDIPIRKTTIRHDAKAVDFPGILQRVLHYLNVPKALDELDAFNLPIEALSELRMRWDWSMVKAKLAVSLAGKHEGWEEVMYTGHPALMKAVQDLGARPPKGKEVVLECQGSSIGTYSTQWMNEFYCSAKGESADTWLDRPRSQRTKLPWPSIKILFPSLQTVKDSVFGMPGGGTMFCRKTQWEAKNFPRELFYDSNSKRGRVLMHSKMIIATFRDRPTTIGGHSQASTHEQNGSDLEQTDEEEELIIEPKEKLVGWAYVGSHNFTPLAWGTLSGSARSPILNIVNYELGVVLPLRTYDELEAVACWKRPARKYIEDVDRPWMQEEMKISQ